MGATDIELAEFFGVCKATINNWKKDYPEFLDSLKEAKAEADSKVVRSLYERANGYSHGEEKIFLHEGKPVKVAITKHYPPDTTACIFWLKNRQKEDWRDRHDVHSEDFDHQHQGISQTNEMLRKWRESHEKNQKEEKELEDRKMKIEEDIDQT